MQKKSFREDINGLRAIAVLSVVIFHFNKDYLPGGFAGVDVFFVISGYLMTSIIFRGLEHNNFSIISFLKARAKRIIPALTIMILALLIIGFLCLEPLTYRLIGKHALSSLLFISNYIYSIESGYFDLGSHDKFLLHTWSLSVEWQFYIIYPMVLLLISKLASINTIKKVIVLFTLLSFVLSCIYTRTHPESSYFMLYTRAWEMMLGGIAYIYPLRRIENNGRCCEIMGVAIIIFSFFIISESTPWPGYMAAIPVFGAYLCIVSNNRNSILSNKIFQQLGLWSYSIYLIHWPIIVLFHKVNIKIEFVTFFLITVILSATLYYFVEKKRDYKYGMILLYLITLSISYYVKIDGVSFRLSNDDLKLSLSDYRRINEGHAGLKQSSDVIYINSDESDFEYVLIGSSHARHYNSFFIDNNIKVASFALDGCNSTKNQYNGDEGGDCDNVYSNSVEFIKKHPNKKIIWATLWNNWGAKYVRDGGEKSNAINEIEYFMQDIEGSNSSVYIISEVPGASFIAFECLAKKDLPINKLISFDCQKFEPKKHSKFNDDIVNLELKYKDLHLIDISKSLCSESSCMIIDNSIPIYTDYGHLSKHGANIVGRYIINQTK